MKAKSFIATNGNGLARAHQSNGDWLIDFTLAGQRVTCLALDPHNPLVVFAGTQGNGVLRSDDGGQTWAAGGLTGQVVKALAISPVEPGVIYAGTKPAFVFRSRDGGKSWEEIESFRRIPGRRWWFSPAEPPFQAYVQSFALSPVDPKLIVAGIEAGAVVVSTDGGETWTGHRPGAVRDCHSLFFHPSDGDWVYEGGGSGAAYSQDGGKTWRQPRQGLKRRYCWAVAADPGDPQVWYVSASPIFSWKRPGNPPAHVDGQADAAIYRSTGGNPWQRLAGGLPDPLAYMPYALLTDPQAPGHLYAGLSNGQVWFSPDHGEAWERLPFSLGAIRRTMVMI